MEAEDKANETVMSKELQEIYKDNQLAGLEWQAEISFKAGHDSRKDEIEGLMSVAFLDGEKSEQERILIYLKRLLVSNPKASLVATIDLIEATKPNSRNGG